MIKRLLNALGATIALGTFGYAFGWLVGGNTTDFYAMYNVVAIYAIAFFYAALWGYKAHD